MVEYPIFSPIHGGTARAASTGSLSGVYLASAARSMTGIAICLGVASSALPRYVQEAAATAAAISSVLKLYCTRCRYIAQAGDILSVLKLYCRRCHYIVQAGDILPVLKLYFRRCRYIVQVGDILSVLHAVTCSYSVV